MHRGDGLDKAQRGFKDLQPPVLGCGILEERVAALNRGDPGLELLDLFSRRGAARRPQGSRGTMQLSKGKPTKRKACLPLLQRGIGR